MSDELREPLDVEEVEPGTVRQPPTIDELKAAIEAEEPSEEPADE